MTSIPVSRVLADSLLAGNLAIVRGCEVCGPDVDCWSQPHFDARRHLLPAEPPPCPVCGGSGWDIKVNLCQTAPTMSRESAAAITEIIKATAEHLAGRCRCACHKPGGLVVQHVAPCCDGTTTDMGTCPDCKGSGLYTGKLVLTVPCWCCAQEPQLQTRVDRVTVLCGFCKGSHEREVASAVVERWLEVVPWSLTGPSHDPRAPHVCLAQGHLLIYDGQGKAENADHLLPWASSKWAAVLTNVEAL